MPEEEILFSIIVPVYNTEKYIDKCLTSIEKAMDIDCEVIIVNDGSTDNSEQIIKNYLEKLPEKYKSNFRYIKKDNKGLADTKNVGIELAKGKYISVVDSDDYISEDFYSISRKYVNQYDIIIYDLYIVYEKDSSLNYIARACRDDVKEQKTSLISGAMSGSSCNKIIKKELYKNYKFPVGKQYEDTAVTPFILSESNKIKYLPYAMYYYLQRENSIVATNTLVSAFYKICENITNVIETHNSDYDKFKYVINEFFVDRIFEILIQELDEENKKFLSSLEEFKNKNLSTIKYILETNMVYAYQNHYTERQKKMVLDTFKFILEGNYKKTKEIYIKRKIVYYIRSIIKNFVIFLKSILNK